MFSDVDRALPLAAAALILAERLREVRTKRITIPGEVREVYTFRLFVFCGVAMTLGGASEYCANGCRPSDSLLFIGVLLAICSFTIRRSAIAALGRFWSLHVEMRTEHVLVTTGPFRYMRHPVYFSMILELAAVALILKAPVAFLLVMLVFIPTLIRRLSLEEKALRDKFGAAYVEYSRHTFSILPTLPRR